MAKELQASLEDWSRDLSALMQAHGRVKNYYDCKLRIIDRSEPCK